METSACKQGKGILKRKKQENKLLAEPYKNKKHFDGLNIPFLVLAFLKD